jgi:hypothetical protein
MFISIFMIQINSNIATAEFLVVSAETTRWEKVRK